MRLKTTLILLMLAILGGAAVVINAAGSTDTWDGTLSKPKDWQLGSKENPILINSAEELAYMLAHYDQSSQVAKSYYKLTCDVDFINIPWKFPNTTGAQSFIGHFDGDGHIVKNVHIVLNHSLLPQRIGLFTALGGNKDSKAEIRNLHIRNLSVSHTLDRAPRGPNLMIGGLVGTLYPNALIENCTVEGMVVENSCDFSFDTPNQHGFVHIGALYGAAEPSPQDFLVGYDKLDQQIVNSYGEIKKLEAGLWTKVANYRHAMKQGSIADDKSKRGFPAAETITANIVADDAVTYHVTLSDAKPQKYTYRWSLDNQPLEAKTANVVIAHDVRERTLSVEVLDGTKVVASNVIEVRAEDLHVAITDVKKAGNNYNIKAVVLSPEGKDISKDFTFAWHDMDREHKVFGTSQTLTGADGTHCYHVVCRHRQHAECTLATYYSFYKPIYVARHAIQGPDAARFTTDGKEYAEGNDENDGLTPETAVKTLRRAYELLKTREQGGNYWNNMIIIMGDYDDPVFNTHKDEDMKHANPLYFPKNKPATITGLYGNIRNGKLLMISECNVISAETRFESLEFHGSDDILDGEKFALYAQDNSLTMGDGLKMTGYSLMADARGKQPGVNAPNVSIFGGYHNCDDPDLKRKAHRLIFYSGYYGRIVAGDRSSKNLTTTGNVSGTPSNPIRSFIRIETANNANPNHYTFDVALLVGGQADGSCFALDTIDVNAPSNVGRVIGGNLGYGRISYVSSTSGKVEPRPSDSFFGQVIFNLNGGEIYELYGGSLGRNGHAIHPEAELIDSCQTYFYGKVYLELKNGTITGEVYGAGAGGVTGLGDDKHHSLDPHIPYMLSNGKVAYGTYAHAKGKMPHIIIDGADAINLNETEVHIDIQGSTKILGSVYGGGYGYSDNIPTSYVSSQAGSLFGNVYLQVRDQATVMHNIFGGGRGTSTYFENLDDTGYSRTSSGIKLDHTNVARLGSVYGKIWTDISGGHILGSVYGAGRGVPFHADPKNPNENATRYMASVYGSANVHVSGDALIEETVYGGGLAGNLVKSGSLSQYEDGTTHIILDGGRFRDAIYGGGNGLLTGDNESLAASADIEGGTYVFINDGEFVWTDEEQFLGNERLYNVFGGGRKASVVYGDTHIEATHSLFSEEFVKAVGETNVEYANTWDKHFAVCGGGYGQNASVMGDTWVKLNVTDDHHEEINLRNYFYNIKTHPTEFNTRLSKIHSKDAFIDVLGGGFAGSVYGSTHVTMMGNAFVRDIYGGGVFGKVGLRDSLLNESDSILSTNERHYTTGTYVEILSGTVYNVYGGSFISDVIGETHVTIGSPTDGESNNKINIATIYAGNDVSGNIAGGNNQNYGTNLDVWGGNIHHAIYGGGNGALIGHVPSPHDTSRNLITRHDPSATSYPQPHVASVSIRMAGIDETHRVNLQGNFFGGGNNASVGIYQTDEEFDANNYGLKRELPLPNQGRIRINVGSHVTARAFFVGIDGRNFLARQPYYKENGKWIKGFRSDKDFRNYCSMIDFAGLPQLTFNADNSFKNDYPIIDFYGDKREFNTPGEMDAVDVEMTTFFGGSNRASMTSDSTYIYTLPAGLLIRKSVTGACNNAYFSYTETEGSQAGTKRERMGGFVPMHLDTKQYHRLQLNIFNKFDPVELKTNPKTGKSQLYGCNMYAGCYHRGIIYGSTSINFHSDIVGEDADMSQEGPLFNAANWLNSDAGILYGGGYGDSTEVIGSTYISMTGSTLNGAICVPNLLDAFGGGMKGKVVGKTRVTYDGECPGASPLIATKKGIWGKLFGGGRRGDIVEESTFMPGEKAPAGIGTRVFVYSGIVDQVFGGARLANIEGGTYVEINDHSKNHFHTVVRKVYGGNDVAGYITSGKVKPVKANTNANCNTFVRICEDKHEDGTYTGFPFVGEVYAAGNGNYGPHLKNYSLMRRSYDSGVLYTGNNDSLFLAGLARPNVDSAYVEVTGGSIMNLYGGGNNSAVEKNVVISVRYEDNADARATFNRTIDADCYERGKWVTSMRSIRDGYIDDGTTIRTEDNIHRIFGGNNEMDMNVQPKWRLRKGNIGSLYGGCNEGSIVYYDEDHDRNVHSGAGGNPGYTLDLPYPDINIKNVFGGSRMGTVQASKITYSDDHKHIVSVEPVSFAENQYGVTVNISNGTFGRVFGGNDITGTINNGTHIQMSGGQCDEIYGAGNGEYIYKVDPRVDKVTELWDAEAHRWYYLVPPIDSLGGTKASPIEKIRTINKYRPNIAKSFIEVAGGIRKDLTRRMAYVFDAIYCGGNCSTILGPNGEQGKVRLDIGGQLVINNVFLGSNGINLIKDDYIKLIRKYNDIKGDFAAVDKEGKNMLDRFMEAVTMYAFPNDFQFHRNYTECYIGDFYLGGNRGSILTNGDITINFPSSLTIFGKIVGGSNRGDVSYTDEATGSTITHQGGIVWNGIGTKPNIMLKVDCKYKPYLMRKTFNRKDNYLQHTQSTNTFIPVYSGCFESGMVDGMVDAEINDPDISSEISTGEESEGSNQKQSEFFEIPM